MAIYFYMKGFSLDGSNMDNEQRFLTKTKPKLIIDPVTIFLYDFKPSALDCFLSFLAKPNFANILSKSDILL